MSTSARHVWFGPLEDRTIGLDESQGGVTDAAIGFLILVAVILFMAVVWSLFMLGTMYLGSHVADLPFLGQFFGP